MQVQRPSGLKFKPKGPLPHLGNTDSFQGLAVFEDVKLQKSLQRVVQVQCDFLLLVRKGTLFEKPFVQKISPFCWSHCEEYRWQRRIHGGGSFEFNSANVFHLAELLVPVFFKGVHVGRDFLRRHFVLLSDGLHSTDCARHANVIEQTLKREVLAVIRASAKHFVHEGGSDAGFAASVCPSQRQQPLLDVGVRHAWQRIQPGARGNFYARRTKQQLRCRKISAVLKLVFLYQSRMLVNPCSVAVVVLQQPRESSCCKIASMCFEKTGWSPAASRQGPFLLAGDLCIASAAASIIHVDANNCQILELHLGKNLC